MPAAVFGQTKLESQLKRPQVAQVMVRARIARSA
jgi:hypothetical protein